MLWRLTQNTKQDYRTYRGWFSATDGAGVGAFATMVLAIWRGGMRWRALRDALLPASETTAVMFLINAMSPGVPMRETYKGVLGYCGMDVVRIALLVVIPFMALWLPGLN